MFNMNQLKTVCDKKLFNYIAENFTDDVLQAAESFSYIDRGEGLAKSIFFKYQGGGMMYYAYYPNKEGSPIEFDHCYLSKQEVVGLSRLLKKGRDL